MPGEQQLLEDAFVSINGTDISDFVKTLGLTRSREFQNRTSIARLHETQDIGANVRGLSLECFQDYAAGALNELIAPLSRTGEDVTVVWRPDSGPASASNPQYTQTMWIPTYTPEKGPFGDEAMADVTLESRGDEARAVA